MVTAVRPESTVVRLELAHKEVPAAGSARHVWLVVRYGSSESHAYSITLAAGYGSDARRTLSRFPLATWLAVADTVRRNLDDAGDGSPARRPDSRRPGRAGHGDAFHREVARRARELWDAGSRKATQTIAEEAGVSRNTAAGWVRRAREKGFLPRLDRD